jgi:ribose-phosphate pyrophosphokinase
VAALAGMPLGDAILTKWSDGEARVVLRTPVAGKHVIIVQSITSNDALIELLWMINAAVRHRAASVTVVAPF